MKVAEALKKYEEAKTHSQEIYRDLRADIRFSIGKDQWSDADIKKWGEAACISLPVLPQFIHQVVNDMRQNTPSIDVLPGDGEDSDPETAKIFKGLIRYIEYSSRADEVYDTGGEYAVRGGLGFARVDHDYVSSDSMLQELKLRRVQNPQSVYLGPYIECDGSDAEIGFILDKMKKEPFEDQYPGKAFTSFDGKAPEEAEDEITIAEVFVKKYEKIEKQVSEDGALEDYVKEDGEKEKKKKKRTLRKVKICRYKFSGADLLEETTFPGEYIPIIPFHGEEVWVDGKRHLLSLIRQAKGAAKRLNKWAMKESQILDMAPVAPIMAPVGAIESIPDGWTSPDDTMVLRYRMFDTSGNKLDKPERLNPPQIPTGIINAMTGAKESVKEALGMYNDNIGNQSNAISGKAIDAHKEQGSVATFHFADNRTRSIQHIGRILVSAIPEIYDTTRVIQIVGPEEKPQLVGINGAERQEGQEYEHDLTKGKYDVRVTTGASYTTKRQEAAAVLGDLIKQDPEAKMIFGDIWAKNLDVAGSEAIADRFKKVMPPALTADESKGEQAPDMEKMQMQQTLQQMRAQIQQMTAELENKQGEQALKSKELDIKHEELVIKNKELDIRSVEAMNTPVDIPNPRPAQAPTEQMHPEAPEMLPQEVAVEQNDMLLRGQQANAAIQVQSELLSQLQQLTAEVSRPKMVVRDQMSGAIQGIQ